ncbi:MAG: hypothetical protein ABSG53_28435 [Thermoguttaceae bacterium]
MRKLIIMIVAAVATLSGAAMLPTEADAAGCYRVGLSGYHWYGFCAGPRFLYPHRRICQHGHCYYR